MALEQVGTQGFKNCSNGRFFHLQSFGDTLHLQHLSSQHCLGTGVARWDEEGWLPLICWLFCSHTKKTVTN